MLGLTCRNTMTGNGAKKSMNLSQTHVFGYWLLHLLV